MGPGTPVEKWAGSVGVKTKVDATSAYLSNLDIQHSASDLASS